MILSEINKTQRNNSPLLRNGNRNETTHLQGELKVTWPYGCGLHIPEHYLSTVCNMDLCHEMKAQMINEAGANKVIAAALRSVRVDKVANTERFYLLPCKEQQSCS